MVAQLAPFGLAGQLPSTPLTPDSPLQDRVAFAAEFEEVMGQVLDALAQMAPVTEGVTTETVTIIADEGNDVTLWISRPTASPSRMPCIVHLHGGGMAFLSGADTGYVRWREALAATGIVVVGVEFRNSGGKLGPHPYPAGVTAQPESTGQQSISAIWAAPTSSSRANRVAEI
jgi:acetyl esterase